MSVFRSILQKAARVLAAQVARNSLFEKPGERAVTLPLKPEGPVAGANGIDSQEDVEEAG
ncbi:MAG: hypothetical protein VX519_12585 [Myxococcota bacterium]|nr:hypothetical protein [Myxococcota bacterium]